jgi:hypothetical protein
MARAAEGDPGTQARLDELAEEAIRAETEGRRRRREREWEGRGIPERLWLMLHESESGGPGGPEGTAALAAVGKFLGPEETRTVLVLSGGVGVGKTLAAAWGCAFHLGRFVKALDLVRAGLFPDDRGFWPAMQRAGLLAIDDLGGEPLDSKGYGHVAVADLLDRRYDASRKTIVTTNLPRADFQARYGSSAGIRLWDRIREVGVWADLKGPSMRRVGGAT